MLNNDIKNTIQENMLKILTIMMETNSECKDCPLVNELKRLPLDAEQALFRNK